jgi:hypothetical protein
MGDGVDFEDLSHQGFVFIDNGTPAADSGVIEEDAGVAVGLSYFFCEGLDAGGACYVAFIEVDVWCLSRYVN